MDDLSDVTPAIQPSNHDTAEEADLSSKRSINTDIEQVSHDKKLRKIQVCGCHLNDVTRSCVLWCFV